MRLPNAWRAIIEERKVRYYLLSRSHPVERFKAAQLARAGFQESERSSDPTGERIGETSCILRPARPNLATSALLESGGTRRGAGLRASEAPLTIRCFFNNGLRTRHKHHCAPFRRGYVA